MRANKTETLTSTARRQQIVDAAITVLARDGLSGTSLGRIATEAGLSSAGLITYHFTDKDDIFLTMTRTLLGQAAAQLEAAIGNTTGPQSALDAYIETFVRFQHDNPEGVRALWRLAAGWKAPGEGQAFDEGSLCEPLREILRQGVGDGAFRELDVEVVTQSIVRSIEMYPHVAHDGPAAFTRELQELYRRGLR